MGNCILCGDAAGFLKTSHKNCKKLHEQGKSEIVRLVGSSLSRAVELKDLEYAVKNIAARSYIDKQKMNSLIADGWGLAVESAFDDGILTEKEEEDLTELIEKFSLSQQVLDHNGAYSKFIKGAVLREVMDGKLPERIKIGGDIPFNFQKAEKIIWIFEGTSYHIEKTRTHYVGSSQGLSVRIAKGLYYRVGAFKGEKVQTHETIHADTGLMGITNKHIYFFGSSKRFRIAYNKIVSFYPYSDGIGIQRDAQTARPQSFVTGDGWFTYNLITNLAQM